jgi:long-subunit acyl-CoA synthetase (AMP-forming)
VSLGECHQCHVTCHSAAQVRAALGIRKTVVSGGGSLAAHLDLFYEAVGLPVLNGWGLTETSPVLACRRWGDACSRAGGGASAGGLLVDVL